MSANGGKKKESKYIRVSRPKIVAKYNQCMGGIDLIDRMISYYRMGIRSKKWTVKAIIHLLDMGIANAWILYRDDKQKLGDASKEILKFLDFKIRVSNYLLKSPASQNSADSSSFSLVTRSGKTSKSSSGTSTPTSMNRRIEHLPILASHLKNASRCKNPGCQGKTKFYCECCNLFLCLTGNSNCFREYHLKI